jgi:hypothetical protein
MQGTSDRPPFLAAWDGSSRGETGGILDRLLRRSKVINIKGHSCRLKDRGFDKSQYPTQGGDDLASVPM